MKIALRSFAELRHRPIIEKHGEPLHIRLGIATYVHRQAILTDTSENFGRKAFWSFDPVTRVGPNNHLFRQNVTLARMT